MEVTVEKISIVQNEGNRKVKRKIDFYNLDAIIAVGYRVNLMKATQFRKWATETLKEYIIQALIFLSSFSLKSIIYSSVRT